MLSIENAFASFTKDRLAMSMGDEDDGKERKKCLFLFKEAKKEDVEEILKIRRGKGGFDCLFTSSDHGYQDIAEVTLDTLEEEQAVQLVKQILKIVNESQDEQIEILVGKLKNFPLAIKLAATCIKNSKLSASGEVFGICEYLVQYEDFDQTLPRNTGQNEYDRILQITSKISMKEIQKISSNEEVNRVLNTMAYFGPGQIDPGLLLSCDEDEDELYSTFELLEQYSMVCAEEGSEYKLYVMHELVKKAIRSQLSVDEEKQVLSHAIELVCGTEEDFYTRDVGHFLSLFYHSQGCKSLVEESCCLAKMILRILNTLCEYKVALKFGLEAFKVFITTSEGIMMARYKIACTMVTLGEYDLALKILLDLKKQDISNEVFPFLSLDKEIIFIYFKQKRYEEALSYVRSDDFLLVKQSDEKDQCYLDNYLNIADVVAKIFVMKKKYTDALTVLHYGEELRGEFFLKRGVFYLDPSEIYRFPNLDIEYTYALVNFFTSQDKKKI